MMSALYLAARDVLCSRQVMILLGVFWAVNIWASIWYLAPGADDSFFISMALGFINSGDLALMYIDRFQEVFVYLPGYVLAQSLFYAAWNMLDLPISIFTYKIFHLIVVSSLVLVLVTYLQATSSVARDWIFRANLLLALLGVSPFIIDLLYPRPEPFGLFTTVSGILAYHCACRSSNHSVGWFVLSAFLIGLAATTHPSFIITSAGIGIAALYFLIRRKSARLLVLCVVACLIPAAAVAAWYLWHLPVSVEMLMANVSSRSPTAERFASGLVQILRYMAFDHPEDTALAVKVYYAISFSALFLACAGTLMLMVRSIHRKSIGEISESGWLTLAFFLAALLNVVLNGHRIQLYVVLSLAAVLSLVALLPAQRATAAHH